jgi:hypothetical protein
MSLILVVKEALWLRDFVGNLGMSHGSIVMHCDNQSAIHLVKN